MTYYAGPVTQFYALPPERTVTLALALALWTVIISTVDCKTEWRECSLLCGETRGTRHYELITQQPQSGKPCPTSASLIHIAVR